MALSNTSPKEKLEITQILLEIAQGFETLGNKSNIEKLVKDVHGLTEKEILLAQEAKEKISEYLNIIEEQKKRQLVIDADHADLDKRKQEAEKAFAEIEKEKLKLKEVKDNLDDREKILNDRDKGLVQRENDLKAGSDKLNSEKVALEIKAKEIAEYEASLKAKAQALKGLTEGI